jgi:hypothetical protein
MFVQDCQRSLRLTNCNKLLCALRECQYFAVHDLSYRKILP